ncbi:MAG: DNA-directed RNA polymerase subunit omega [Deltaproteobacteria bacterium]|nr:MAG: DNA-directed RNA polymerase subunit omega [Deltaproteobacteria bacterium]
MARVTIEDCLEKVNNRFLLVHLGAKRVIQLRKGAPLLVDAPKNKEVVLALREIAAGEISFDNIVKIDHDEVVVKALEDSSEDAEAETPVEETEKEAAPPAEDQSSGDEQAKEAVEQEDSPDDKAK